MSRKEEFMQGIHEQLHANADLTAIVSDRIYFARAPIDSQFPQVHWFDVSDTLAYQIDFNSVIVQFSMWATNSFEALSLKSELMKYHRYSGTLNGVKVNWAEVIDNGSLYSEEKNEYGSFIRVKYNYVGENIT